MTRYSFALLINLLLGAICVFSAGHLAGPLPLLAFIGACLFFGVTAVGLILGPKVWEIEP